MELNHSYSSQQLFLSMLLYCIKHEILDHLIIFVIYGGVVQEARLTPLSSQVSVSDVRMYYSIL